MRAVGGSFDIDVARDYATEIVACLDFDGPHLDPERAEKLACGLERTFPRMAIFRDDFVGAACKLSRAVVRELGGVLRLMDSPDFESIDEPGRVTTADELADAIEDAHDDAYDIAIMLSLVAKGAVRQDNGVTRAATCLISVAARLLAPGDRARYREEFRSELSDITLARGRRRSQVAYAARQLFTCLSLRKELRVPRRRSAAS